MPRRMTLDERLAYMRLFSLMFLGAGGVGAFLAHELTHNGVLTTLFLGVFVFALPSFYLVAGNAKELHPYLTTTPVKALEGMDVALARLRAAGWTVAVHNDYRLGGKSYTFWLFTRGSTAIKGEGATDAEALAIVEREIGTLEGS